jgi:hypothetical protein
LPRLLLDPWSPDYDAPIQTDGGEVLASGEVDAEVETRHWKPICPSNNVTERRLYFVDGVRRVEARVLSQENDGSLIHGLFAGAAVGSVVTENGLANYDSVEIRRYLILGGGRRKSESIEVGGQTILFEGISDASVDTPDELINSLQNLMRTREAALAESLLAEGACVFADGPLNYFSAPAGALVGVIKRIFLPYLDAGHFALVSQLAAGERTPLFSIRDGKYNRYAWFQRLATPRAMEHGLAGIVRLEVRAALGLLHAIELANFAAVRLPRFASSAVRDPRAPQNLVPVGALEEQLRHRLGDAVTIRRAIERKIWAGVTI